MTKLTESIRLQLRNNWTSYTKPLSINLLYFFFLTSSSSLLLLPLFVNFLTSLLLFYKYSYFHLNLERKASPSYSTGNPLSICIIKQLSKQAIEKEMKLADLMSSKAFLKDFSSASMPIYSSAIIPYLGLPGVSFLKGSNITDFLKSYN